MNNAVAVGRCFDPAIEDQVLIVMNLIFQISDHGIMHTLVRVVTVFLLTFSFSTSSSLGLSQALDLALVNSPAR